MISFASMHYVQHTSCSEDEFEMGNIFAPLEVVAAASMVNASGASAVVVVPSATIAGSSSGLEFSNTEISPLGVPC